MTFPTLKEFITELLSYFKPANATRDAAHQLLLLKQDKKTAEEVITDFRLLTSQAGYSITSASDQLHLIEKLRNVLNASLVKKVMLMDTPPTTLDAWVQKAIQVDTQYRETMETLKGRKTE